VNSALDFRTQVESVLAYLKEARYVWSEDEKEFVRAETFWSLRVRKGDSDVKLKLDFVNDVPAHFGGFTKTAIFDRTDSIRNILSNKLSALFRFAAKDVADIREIALHERFFWPDIAGEACQKDTGVDLPMFGEMLETIRPVDFQEIHWTEDIPWERFIADVKVIAHDMVFCKDNSLACSDGRGKDT
jgi:hypothetical protein